MLCNVRHEWKAWNVEGWDWHVNLVRGYKKKKNRNKRRRIGETTKFRFPSLGGLRSRKAPYSLSFSPSNATLSSLCTRNSPLGFPPPEFTSSAKLIHLQIRSIISDVLRLPIDGIKMLAALLLTFYFYDCSPSISPSPKLNIYFRD